MPDLINLNEKRNPNPNRSFFQSLILLVVLNLLIKPVWIFAIDRKVQIITGSAAYGNYFALLNLSMIFNMIIDFGITNYSNREAAINKNAIGDLFQSGLSLKLILSVFYFLFLLAITLFIHPEDTGLIIWLLINQVLISFTLYLRSYITARQLFNTEAWLSVMDRTMLVLFCGMYMYIPMWQSPITVLLFAQIQVISSFITLITCLFIFIQKHHGIRFRFSISFSRKALLSGLPYAAIIFFMSMHNRADGYLIERLHPAGEAEAGIYAASYRLLDAANMVGFLFASLLMPFWSHHIQDSKIITQSLNNAFRLLLPPGLVGAVFLFVFHKQAFSVLYERIDDYAAKVLQWSFLSIIFYYCVHLFGTLLTALGYWRKFLIFLSISVFFNLISNIIFIPQYGAMCAAVVSLFSQGVLVLLLVVFSAKNLKHPIKFEILAKVVLQFIVCIIVVFFLWKAGEEFWVSLFITGAVWMIAGLIFKVYTKQAILQLLRQN